MVFMVNKGKYITFSVNLNKIIIKPRKNVSYFKYNTPYSTA